MKKELIIAILAGIITYYLCGNVFPFFESVIAKYPFQSFVASALMAIMVLLTFLTVRLKRGQ